jgi:AraC-like DNA-binding protein
MPETGFWSPSDRTPPTFATNELDHARLHMAQVFRPHHLVLHGRTRALAMRHRRVALGNASFHWLEYGAPVTMSAPGMGRFYLFQTNLDGTCRVRQDALEAPVAEGHSYAVNPDSTLTKSWSPDCRQLIVRVEREALERLVMRELGVDLDDPLEFDFAPLARDGGTAALLRIIAALGGDDAGLDSWTPDARSQRYAERMVMSLLLTQFPHSYSERFQSMASCAPHYVRRAETFIRANLREPITMDDLVAAAGVSGRSLQNGFRRFRDTTPMAFVKALRLDLAREELQRSSGADSVTRVALACGFTHMSKFSRAFKARFGELPAAVLRRR